ncbi:MULTISPECIES: methyltransferase domain-containing protein [unclassified Ruegeria]|uniref:class I SAM-dependent methyltransferase n=1 Tax=unclassified Ruegeria TaxID=2625375 RepID=UPI001488D493|nr:MULTISPECIES: methyltransferase domain-containing protein [unclassified Ruegeria]
MDLKEHQALGDRADDHWYYTAKANVITQHFGNRPHEVLDVGAGLGWFSKWLLSNNYADSAICVDPGYEDETEDRLPNGTSIQFVRSLDHSSADLVLMMDVLEHVDDDVALLSEYWKKARPGTVFIITVPAFEFLWSAHDEFLEHRRRYTIQSLTKTIRAVKAEPEAIHYYYGAIFPAAALVRLATRGREANRSDMKPLPDALNGILKSVCKIERFVMKANRLAGLTVVAKLVKPVT